MSAWSGCEPPWGPWAWVVRFGSGGKVEDGVCVIVYYPVAYRPGWIVNDEVGCPARSRNTIAKNPAAMRAAYTQL